jgi:hypothetical protein
MIRFSKNQEHLSDAVNGTNRYMFVTHAGDICASWVPEGDAEEVLRLKRGCGCGGNTPATYRYASDLEAKRWVLNDASATL